MALIDWRWINTPVGGYWVRPDVGEAYEDLWRGWFQVERQLHGQLPRRMAKAKSYRLRFLDAVRV